MRHGLLLTAVATVTVPGLLAMAAVLGHEHVPAAASVAVAALDGAPEPTPVAVPSTAKSPQEHDFVALQHTSAGGPLTVLSSVTIGQQAMGMRLLDQAAEASLTTSYEGTEVVKQSGVDGSVQLTSLVWHQGGGTTFVETLDDPASATTHPTAAASGDIAVASTDPASGSPEGVFGVTKDLVTLAGKHYVALYWGSGSVVGRPASVVELYRSNGTLAAQYWLDSRTGVPLRRELYDTSGHVVISDDSFVTIQFGAVALPRIAGTGAAAAQAQPVQSDWVTAASPAKLLSSLAKQGWQVPTTSPGGLPLYAAASTTTASGEIIDLEYSDGLYDISLFMQRGTLAPDMPGWRTVSVAGQQAFVSGHSVTWARAGVVYTVIADAPPQTVTQVVKTLGSDSPGVVDRLGRGLVKLAQVINPFH